MGLFFQNTDYDYATKMDVGKFVDLTNLAPSMLNSWVISQILQITEYKNFIVTKEAGFLDYIAYSAYGDHSYWWIIALFNSILDEETELPEGSIIKIPNINSLNKIMNELKASETLYNNNAVASLSIYK